MDTSIEYAYIQKTKAATEPYATTIIAVLHQSTESLIANM